MTPTKGMRLKTPARKPRLAARGTPTSQSPIPTMRPTRKGHQKLPPHEPPHAPVQLPGQVGHQGLVGLGEGQKGRPPQTGQVVEEVDGKGQGGEELEDAAHQGGEEAQEVSSLAEKPLDEAQQGFQKTLQETLHVAAGLGQDGLQAFRHRDGLDAVGKAQEPGPGRESRRRGSSWARRESSTTVCAVRKEVEA
jgi:hypothetical protein